MMAGVPLPLLADASALGRWGPIALTAALGMAAIGILLPRPSRRPILLGAALGAAALASAAIVMVQVERINFELLLFYAFAGLALIAGGMMITQANPARAALAFAVVVLSTCGLFLLNAAPFLMAGTVIVYAGAIVVTFLFVLMLSQTDGRSDADDRSREPVLAAIAGFFLLATLLLVLQQSFDPRDYDNWLSRLNTARNQPENVWRILGGDEQFRQESEDLIDRVLPRESARKLVDVVRSKDDIAKVGTPSAENSEAIRSWLDRLHEAAAARRGEVVERMGRLAPPAKDKLSPFAGQPANQPTRKLGSENVAGIGRALFTDYLLAIELGGTLLLIATVGAIVIAQRPSARRAP